MNKCVITSNSVASRILNIHEYNIEIKHIKGVQNHLDEILSREPTAVTDEGLEMSLNQIKYWFTVLSCTHNRPSVKILKDLEALPG